MGMKHTILKALAFLAPMAGIAENPTPSPYEDQVVEQGGVRFVLPAEGDWQRVAPMHLEIDWKDQLPISKQLLHLRFWKEKVEHRGKPDATIRVYRISRLVGLHRSAESLGVPPGTAEEIERELRRLGRSDSSTIESFGYRLMSILLESHSLRRGSENWSAPRGNLRLSRGEHFVGSEVVGDPDAAGKRFFWTLVVVSTPRDWYVASVRTRKSLGADPDTTRALSSFLMSLRLML